MNIWGDVIGGITDLIKGELEGRRRLKEAKVNAEIAIAEKKIDADVNWDQIQATNSATSWKDEFVTINIYAIIWLHFIPWTADEMLLGWETLSKAPQWFATTIVVITAASFGVRQIINGYKVYKKGKSNGFYTRNY